MPRRRSSRARPRTMARWGWGSRAPARCCTSGVCSAAPRSEPLRVARSRRLDRRSSGSVVRAGQTRRPRSWTGSAGAVQRPAAGLLPANRRLPNWPRAACRTRRSRRKCSSPCARLRRISPTSTRSSGSAHAPSSPAGWTTGCSASARRTARQSLRFSTISRSLRRAYGGAVSEFHVETYASRETANAVAVQTQEVARAAGQVSEESTEVRFVRARALDSGDAAPDFEAESTQGVRCVCATADSTGAPAWAPRVRDVVLRDGTGLRLGTPTSEDYEDIKSFYDELSQESRYSRFAGFVPTDLPARLDAEADGDDRVALPGLGTHGSSPGNVGGYQPEHGGCRKAGSRTSGRERPT